MVDIDDNETDENNEDNEDTSNVIFQQPLVMHRNKKGDKVHKNDTPIENSDDIPLFSDADKRGMRSVTYLRIVKLDNPKSGYKGDLPINSTLATISNLYGDGIYNIEACNSRHQVLRTKENVKISLENGQTSETRIATKSSSDNTLDAIRELNRQHQIEIDRIIKEVGRSATESKSNSDQFIKLVTTTTESSLARDREHYASVNKSQQDFFANIMVASQQGFQQMMMLMTMGHQHLIEALRATYEGSNNNKSSDVDTLLKGIMVAQSLGGNDDPDWLKALDKGGNMMKSLLALKQSTSTDDSPDTPEIPTPKTSKQNSNEQPKKTPISKTELLEILRLKKVLNARGIDLEEMMRQAREHYIDEDTKPSASTESNEDSTTEQTE